MLYVVVAAVAVCSAAFEAANGAMAPSLVETDDYAQAMTMSSTRDSIIALITPMISAATVVGYPAVPFLIDSASYVVSFACLRNVHPLRTEAVARPRSPARIDATAGFVALARARSLLSLTIATSALNFGLQICVYVTLYQAVRIGEAAWTGVILGMQSIGLIVGSLLAKRLFLRLSPLTVVVAHVLVWSIAFLAVAFCVNASARIWPALIILPAMWMTAPLFRTVVSAHTVAVVPPETLGRAAAASSLIAMSIAAGSQSTAAYAVTHGAVPAVVIACAAAAIGVVCAGVAAPARIRRRPLECHGRPVA